MSNFLVKTSTGLGIGILSSVILFKRRTWPLQLFTGFGAGWAYADCDRVSLFVQIYFTIADINFNSYLTHMLVSLI